MKNALKNLREGGGIGWTWEASQRWFAGMFVMMWRDKAGINPGFLWVTHKTGTPDPHLLPFGFKTIWTNCRLFGDRSIVA